MNAKSSGTVIVEPGGIQVVDHVGSHALGMFDDRLGVSEALSQAVAASRAPISSCWRLRWEGGVYANETRREYEGDGGSLGVRRYGGLCL